VVATVVDSQGRPIEGAELLVGAPWDREALVARSDAEGRFQGEFPNPPTLQFAVLADGFEGARRYVEGARGAELRLGEFRLAPGGQVEGRVVDEAGVGLADANIEWFPAAAFPRNVVSAREIGPEIEDWDEERYAPFSSSGADGRFLLRGLPLGECFLAANADARLHGWTSLFEVGSGPLPEQTIVLPESPHAALRILGLVVDPNGVALEGIAILCSEDRERELQPLRGLGYVGGVSGAWATTTSDAEGRFTITGWNQVIDLGAQDPKRRWATTWLDDVRPGTQDLVLRMRPPVWMVVRLVDPEGRAVPWGHVRYENEHLEGGREGLVRLHRPEMSFTVEVSAPGFKKERLGPLEPPSPGEELRLTLQPGQSLRGRVLHLGRPVGGALLDLAPTPSPGEPSEASGCSPQDHPFLAHGSVELGGNDGTSDTAGAFVLTIHSKGWHGLRVEAEGFPLTVFGPFELAPEAGVEGLELELERGGVLEGFVREAPGNEPIERLVAVSNGWGFARTAPVDERGAYRIEDLAPGPYQVRPCLPPAASLQMLERTQAKTLAIEWDCSIRAGETTRFDLDLATEGSVVLEGHLEFVGAEPGQWEVDLLRAGTGLERVVSPRAHLPGGSDGTFELALSRPGPYQLRLRSGPLWILEELELFSGRNEWRRRFELGRVWLHAAEGTAVMGTQSHLRYVALDTGKLEFIAWFPWWREQAGNNGLRFTAPLGSGRLETSTSQDPDDWTSICDLTLAPGEELRLELH
jgi:hypothetical protein